MIDYAGDQQIPDDVYVQKLMVKCVNAHDFCDGMFDCPLCEAVFPFRWEDGRFAGLSNSQPAHTDIQPPNKTADED